MECTAWSPAPPPRAIARIRHPDKRTAEAPNGGAIRQPWVFPGRDRKPCQGGPTHVRSPPPHGVAADEFVNLLQGGVWPAGGPLGVVCDRLVPFCAALFRRFAAPVNPCPRWFVAAEFPRVRDRSLRAAPAVCSEPSRSMADTRKTAPGGGNRAMTMAQVRFPCPTPPP